MPSSCSITDTPLPLPSNNRSASCRNSAVYTRRFVFMTLTPLAYFTGQLHCPAFWGQVIKRKSCLNKYCPPDTYGHYQLLHPISDRFRPTPFCPLMMAFLQFLAINTQRIVQTQGILIDGEEEVDRRGNP